MYSVSQLANTVHAIIVTHTVNTHFAKFVLLLGKTQHHIQLLWYYLHLTEICMSNRSYCCIDLAYCPVLCNFTL